MKTAEEWSNELHYVGSMSSVIAERSMFENNLQLIKQIQFDAFKSGMTEAARICDVIDVDFTTDRGYSQAILSARDKKTSL